MPQLFEESDLQFIFPDDWVVRKFDGTRAYQSLSGHGLKGVDFIALSPDERLWLVEVKNYRPRYSDARQYKAQRRTPRALAEHLVGKLRDTQRLLRIVNKSLTANWWFPAWRVLRRLKPNRNSNYWFWTEAYRRALLPYSTECVLWLETPERESDYDSAVKRELEMLLPEGMRVHITERGGNIVLPFSRL